MMRAKYILTDIDYVEMMKIMTLINMFIKRLNNMPVKNAPKEYQDIFADETKKLYDLKSKLQYQIDAQNETFDPATKSYIKMANQFVKDMDRMFDNV